MREFRTEIDWLIQLKSNRSAEHHLEIKVFGLCVREPHADRTIFFQVPSRENQGARSFHYEVSGLTLPDDYFQDPDIEIPLDVVIDTVAQAKNILPNEVTDATIKIRFLQRGGVTRQGPNSVFDLSGFSTPRSTSIRAKVQLPPLRRVEAAN